MYSGEDNNVRPHRTDTTMKPTKAQNIFGTIFGIVMIIIYVGMGVLLLINFFNWDNDWAWTRYVVGVVLIIYGFWRGYRQYKGIDSRF